jgi:hypothetical protein
MWAETDDARQNETLIAVKSILLVWHGRPRPFGGYGPSRSVFSLSWWPPENADGEYTMNRGKLKDKAEETNAHAGKTAQARRAKQRKAQNG